MKNEKERLLYFKNRKLGKCAFNGKMEMTDEVSAILKKEKIGKTEIRNKLQEVIERNKENFGSLLIEYYGLHFHQKIIDIQSRIVLDIKQPVENSQVIVKRSHIIDKQPFTVSIATNNFPFEKNRKTDSQVQKMIREGQIPSQFALFDSDK